MRKGPLVKRGSAIKKGTQMRNIVNIARKVAKQTMNKNVETKRSNYTCTDGTEIAHNSFITLNSKILETTQGVSDPYTTANNNRIGDEIMLNGVSIKFMVELNERYSDVTFRFILIKCAKGDVPSASTLWTGLSGNKMIDTFNTERYTIIKSKTFKVTAANAATTGGIKTAGAGYHYNNEGDSVISRATKIMKFWIPGRKFSKNGKIKYENALDQVKFFDYHALLYAYSNFSTSSALSYNVGRINDYVQVMYYKDA